MIAPSSGLSIPDDVAVVGFDNQLLIAAYLRPALTTVALPFTQMGARAVELVLARLEGNPVPALTVIDCPMIERHSV